MDQTTIVSFSKRLNTYLHTEGLNEFSVIFHGGEPLLYSAEGLSDAAQVIRNAIPNNIKIEFSVQSNGVLLSDAAISILENAEISISLSLDGNKDTNDLHRLDHQGHSSFNATLNALNRLRHRNSQIFSGVIAVIDPTVPPIEVFDFFYPLDIPRLDLLLPDATHDTPPLGREKDFSLYTNWLLEAFALWYDQYNDLPVRFFDSVLGTRLGIPSPTDALGFGQVSLLVIETDGSYTDHDVFKITKPSANRLNGTVRDTEFKELISHTSIVEHNFRLSIAGVAQECKTCPIIDACGGGSIMHRYHSDRGLDTPSVYCSEMFHLIAHATETLQNELDTSMSNSDLQIEPFSIPDLNFSPEFTNKCISWRSNFASQLPKRETNGYSKNAQLWLGKVRVSVDSEKLVQPFSDSIRVVPRKSAKFSHGVQALDRAKSLLSLFSPNLVDSISELLSDIVFVESTLPDESGIFSFSDDSMPNVIYLDPYVGSKPLPADDIADSILHEFLHHVLYHLELDIPLLHNYDVPRFPAPWRKGLRSAGGFLHGTFVFSGLTLFWRKLADTSEELSLVNKSKAVSNSKKFFEQAKYGLQSANRFALLTPNGKKFVQQLALNLGVSLNDIQPPGILYNQSNDKIII